MKQNYEAPEAAVIYFDNEDIVTASSIADLTVGGDNDLGFDQFGTGN